MSNAPKDPNTPIGETEPTESPSRTGLLDPVNSVTAVEAADRASAVDRVAGDNLVIEVVKEVRLALRSGAISSPDAALDAVIERLVERRYQSMGSRERLRFAGHLRSILPADPVVGATLRELIETDDS